MAEPAARDERRRMLAGGLGAAALLLAGGCAAPTVMAPAGAPGVEPPAGGSGVPGTPPAGGTGAAGGPVGGDQPPPAPREFRAAWVATVANIDWPSRPGLPAEAQRAEALALLDRARAIGLNALILQVRPAGDAIYPSSLEPWSEYLSGEQGRAPAPGWDPLAFWVEQAHRRGLELHAWFNPYRARHTSAKTPLVAPHIGVREPALVKRYGDLLWMDPGEPAAAAHTLAVVADVLRRYDIDGVHIDDYFYPYPVQVGGTDLPFPDDEAWVRFQLGGGPLARDDWRRANVDTLVQALHRLVHEIRPQARFGISPFGIGRPDRRPPGITGFSQYDKLYADAERWLQSGWLDYLAPQLYWPIAKEGQQFPVLLDYWIGANTAQRHVWPGLYTSQVGKVWPARELVDQVALLRTRPAAGGHVHFSMVALQQDRDGLATLLQMGAYAEAALVPEAPWLPTAPPPPVPRLAKAGPGRVQVEPEPLAARWAVWRRIGGAWRFAMQPAAERIIATSGADLVAVAAVDRGSRTGERAIMRLP